VTAWKDHDGAVPTTVDEACQPVPTWHWDTAFRRYEVTLRGGSVVIIDTTDVQRAFTLLVDALGADAGHGTLRELTGLN
jgi:hypothetical protein